MMNNTDSLSDDCFAHTIPYIPIFGIQGGDLVSLQGIKKFAFGQFL